MLSRSSTCSHLTQVEFLPPSLGSSRFSSPCSWRSEQSHSWAGPADQGLLPGFCPYKSPSVALAIPTTYQLLLQELLGYSRGPPGYLGVPLVKEPTENPLYLAISRCCCGQDSFKAANLGD